jgi:hypothetical protein
MTTIKNLYHSQKNIVLSAPPRGVDVGHQRVARWTATPSMWRPLTLQQTTAVLALPMSAGGSCAARGPAAAVLVDDPDTLKSGQISAALAETWSRASLAVAPGAWRSARHVGARAWTMVTASYNFSRPPRACAAHSTAAVA